MKYITKRCFQQIIIMGVFVLIASGCAASPTSQPQAVSPQANLNVLESSVKIIDEGDSERDLARDSTAAVDINDRVVLDQTGRGILSFQDDLEVELFPNADIRLDDFQQEPGGATLVRIAQNLGQSRVRLNEGSNARVILETEYETITTLLEGTEFLVCHAPGKVTCQVVTQGAIEVTAQGKKVIIPAGEATYVAPNSPPSPPICVQQDEFSEWLAKLQAAQESEPLGALVARWPQESCSVQVAQGATLEAPSEVPSLPAAEGMVRIEAGIYVIGKDEADEFHIARREVDLGSYWIDVYEVTNAEYQTFIQETGHPEPAVWPGQENHPVKGITWNQAAEYCAWANKRLPSEAEWEVAARGPGQDPPLYPWGSEPLAGGQVSDLPRSESYAVGAYPFNQSPFGVYDMAGNVWEWVGDGYDEVAEGNRILRGGRHGLLKDMAYRQEAQPDDERFIPFAGFRCAADQVAGE